MRLSFWHRLDHAARAIAPFGLCFVLILLSVVPIRLSGYSPIVPWFLLIAVYFWTLHRPDLLPPWSVFVLSFFADFLTGAQLGITAFVSLILIAVLQAQRRVILAASFFIQWIIFSVVALAAETLHYLLNVLLQQQAVDPLPAAFQYLMTVAIYPSLAWLFVLAQRAFLRQV